ncbi:unnamed protein product, partial [Discosporangium mesarthrocarpum]
MKTVAGIILPVLGGLCFTGTLFAFLAYSPEPYMDEVFHIPQTKAATHSSLGAWSDDDNIRGLLMLLAGHWDAKITTLPGLYLCAVVYAWIIYLLRYAGSIFLGSIPGDFGFGWEDDLGLPCSPGVLRQVNWLFSLGLLTVMKALLQRRMSTAKALGHATVLWLYPVSFFFGFLYYTDMGSTFFILLCYLLASGGR